MLLRNAIGTWNPANLLPLATLGNLHSGIAANLMFFSLPALVTLTLFFRLLAQPSG